MRPAKNQEPLKAGSRVEDSKGRLWGWGAPGERALGARANACFYKYSQKGSHCPCCTELFSFLLKVTILAILASLAKDKLHINYSDIIPFFTHSM